jgi:hypothetical protein
VFPIVTNDQQLRLLLRSRLQVTVVDMHGEEAEDPSDGLIGTVHRYRANDVTAVMRE